MLSVAHTIISLPFGVYLNNPLLVFAAAFVMHLLADTLLHWNIYPYKYKQYPYGLVLLDTIGGVVIAYMVLGDATFSIPILAAIAGGNAPDVLQGIWDMLPKATQKKFGRLINRAFVAHDKLQYETTHPSLGLISQITLAAVAVLIL